MVPCCLMKKISEGLLCSNNNDSKVRSLTCLLIPSYSNTFSDWGKTCHVSWVKTHSPLEKNNLNFRLARDQVVLLETAAVPAGLKSIHERKIELNTHPRGGGLPSLTPPHTVLELWFNRFRFESKLNQTKPELKRILIVPHNPGLWFSQDPAKSLSVSWWWLSLSK